MLHPFNSPLVPLDISIDPTPTACPASANCATSSVPR